MKILIHPDSFLKILVPLCKEPVSDHVIAYMMGVIDDTKALGLAANQLGYSYRVIIVQNKVMVNPSIVDFSGLLVFNNENCLSLPGETFCVKRDNAIMLRWQSLDLETTYTQGFNGNFAYIVQHEIDHLNGVLINDNMLD